MHFRNSVGDCAPWYTSSCNQRAKQIVVFNAFCLCIFKVFYYKWFFSSFNFFVLASSKWEHIMKTHLKYFILKQNNRKLWAKKIDFKNLKPRPFLFFFPLWCISPHRLTLLISPTLCCHFFSNSDPLSSPSLPSIVSPAFWSWASIRSQP